MRLYSGTTNSLQDDTLHNRIATKLADAFFYYYRFQPPPSEVTAWRNSLRAVSQVFQSADLLDNGVLLEFQLPLTSRRLDCLVTGCDVQRNPNAVVIELKQWEKCQEGPGRNEVAAWIGGRLRDVLHPSVQVGQYKSYLEDYHPAFSPDGGIGLHACSYLHNYGFDPSDVIFSAKFSEILNYYPLFTGDEVDRLVQFIQPKLVQADRAELIQKIEQSRYRPSKKLLDHVAAVIKGKSEYVLLDEQLIVYDRVLEAAERGFGDKKKTVIIVKGGPGTGKSVIALKLLGDLSGKGINTHYVTGSRAFTRTVREIVGSRAAIQIRYFNSYSQAEFNAVDAMVCDEAHRLRISSNSRFTPRSRRTNLPQTVELLNAAKTAVFFIDDNQIVRPGEIGSVEYIERHALGSGCKVLQYELETQFRCSGSDGFVNWVNNTLGIQRTANVLWNLAEPFDFKIFDSPWNLDAAIRQKAKEGFTARMAAGFCWKWSDPNPDGTLANDVVIGDFARPWNAKSDEGHLAPGIPPESLWAYDPNGMDQIGCIYTAQGFEFDYIGVIFGRDLMYNPAKATWEGNRSESADPVVRRSKGEFIKFAKNTYRVLLTRGMKGCYVYFMDKATENFIRSRLEISAE